MKKILSIIIVIILLMAMITGALAQPQDKEQKSKISSSLPKEIIREVLNVSFSNYTQVNNTIYKATWLLSSPHCYARNTDVRYDPIRNAANLSATKARTGGFAISGFTSAIRTTVSIDILVRSYGFNDLSFALQTHQFMLGITSYNSYVKYGITWYDGTGTVKGRAVNSEIWGVGKIPTIRLQIDWYENRTFYFSFKDLRNGDIEFQGWNKTRQDDARSTNGKVYYIRQQPEAFPNYIFLDLNPGSAAQNNVFYSVYLRNLTQKIIVKQADVYADIPTKKYVGWGFDGCYKSTFYNASQYLFDVGAKTTWFFDRNFTMNASNPANRNWHESWIPTLLANKQELGIHFGDYSTYNTAKLASIVNDANWLISIYERNGWTNRSFAWTAWGNWQEGRFTDYFWKNYSSIGRQIWAHPFHNQGGMPHGFTNYNFSNLTINMTLRGHSYVAYCHGVGGPGQEISIPNFRTMINLTYAKGMEIIGYMEFWSRYNAPFYVSGTLTNVNAYLKTLNMQYAYLNLKTPVEIRFNLSAVGIEPNEKFKITVADPNKNLYAMSGNMARIMSSTEVPYTISDNYAIFDAFEGVNYTIYIPTHVGTELVNVLFIGALLLLIAMLIARIKSE